MMMQPITAWSSTMWCGSGITLAGHGWLFLRVPHFYAVEPALLHKFFEMGICKDSYAHALLFGLTAPVAMAVDQTLSQGVAVIDKSNGWAEPVANAADVQAELADNGEAGGTVHTFAT